MPDQATRKPSRRIVIGSALVLLFLLYTVAMVVARRPGTHPPDFSRMPHRFGIWVGKDLLLKSEIRAILDAEVIIDREYRQLSEQMSVPRFSSAIRILSHVGVFADWDAGLHHNPLRVYRAAGWKLLSETCECPVTVHGKDFRVSRSVWSKDGQRVMVVYWYQLGHRTILDKSELDRIRPELQEPEHTGRLAKVQLQVDLSDDDQAADAIEDLAGNIANWLNNPFYD